MTECDERQQEEIEALLAVWPGDVRSATGPDGLRRITVTIHADLGQDRPISIRRGSAAISETMGNGLGRQGGSDGGSAEPRRRGGRDRKDVRRTDRDGLDGGASAGEHAERVEVAPTQIRLRYLLPFHFSAILPPTYPDTAPELILDCSWLPESVRRTAKVALDSIYNSTEAECLALCVDYLQNDLFQSLDRISLEDDGHAGSLSLVERLRQHDRVAADDSFSRESFRCEICLEDRKGARCYRVERCRHVSV